MTFNFWLNNFLTYRDRRLTTPGAVLRGWLSFIAACSVGAFANGRGGDHAVRPRPARSGRGVVGIGSVRCGTTPLSSRFVWGRY
jgi:dolichol-phosphate mannosyltransferase